MNKKNGPEGRFLGGIIIATALMGLMVFLQGFGVACGETAQYVFYVLFYILCPGILLSRWLFPERRNLLFDICVGWTSGFLVEGAVYVLVALTGLRILFFTAVPFIIIFAVFAGRGRVRPRVMQPLGVRGWFVLGGLCLAVILLWSVHSFRHTPLPEADSGVTYYQDLLFHLGNTVELKNRFPLESPRVSGTPLSYAFGSNVHMAVASLITRVEASTILLRLFPVELLILWVFCLFWAGYELSGGVEGGVLVVLLTIFVRSLSGVFQLLIGYATYRWNGETTCYYLWDFFRDQMLSHPYLSPSFLFGMPIFIAVMVLIAQQLRTAVLNRRVAILIIFYLIGGAFAKATILPVLMLGLSGTFTLYFFLTRKRQGTLIFLFLAALVTYFVVKPFVLGLYSVDGYVVLKPFDFVFATPFWKIMLGYIQRNLPMQLMWLWKSGLFLLTFFGYAPVAVIGFLLWLVFKVKTREWDIVSLWLVNVFFMTFLLIMAIKFGPGQWYFWAYAFVAFVVLASRGLIGFYSQRPYVHWYYFIHAGIVFSAVLVVFTTCYKCVFPVVNEEYCRNRYGDYPLLTKPLLEALRWLRDHSGVNDIVAVNFNDYPGQEKEKYWYYSAFSERRIFLEGTYNTKEQVDWNYLYHQDPRYTPFADRRQLLEDFFNQKQGDALAVMAQGYGVRYVLIDKRWRPPEKFLGDGPGFIKVFSSPQVDIFKINLTPTLMSGMISL